MTVSHDDKPDELQRALARSDARKMCQQIDAYADYYAKGAGDWPDDSSDDLSEITTCAWDNPEKALSYVVLAAARSDDPEFLGFMACGPLEDLLDGPSPQLLDRIVGEAGRSARFRWLLSHPFKIAIAERAWEAIREFRSTGQHEEPLDDTLPPKELN